MTNVVKMGRRERPVATGTGKAAVDGAREGYANRVQIFSLFLETWEITQKSKHKYQRIW